MKQQDRVRSKVTDHILTHVHDSDLDAMIAKARAVVNDDERLKAYMDIQKYIADKLYVVSGLPVAYEYRMIQPWLQNYQPSVTYAFATETYSKLWLQR